MRQVEEALARQVIYGGDLVTNLLEVARVDEAVLTGLLAESMRLSPAPRWAIQRSTPNRRDRSAVSNGVDKSQPASRHKSSR